MCLQLFCPFPSLPQLSPFYSPAGFPYVGLLRGQQTLSRLAQGDLLAPAIRGDGKTKRLHLFSLNSAPNPMPHHPSVSILFLWLMLKATQCLRISTCPHPLSPPSTLNPVHLPQLNVYLRLRFSDNEGLNVNSLPVP